MALHGAVQEGRRGRLLIPSIWVILSDRCVVYPDLAYVSCERRHLVTEVGIRGVPDLVGEIVSVASVRIDRVFKHNLYAKYGVKYYWIIEPLAEWIRAYELGADGLYELVAEAHGNAMFSARPFPDLQIDLAALWADPMA